MIDWQGSYKFRFLSNENDPWGVGTMSGKVNSLNYFVTYYVNSYAPQGAYMDPAVTPRVTLQGDSLMVVFLFKHQDVADSVALRCARVSASPVDP
jgi:hypothetical protein